MVQTPKLRSLLEAGVHFGHSKSRRHPRAERFIFTTRDNTSIINLESTARGLDAALQFIEQLASSGKLVLFVATKRQAKMIVTETCKKAGIPYVAERWVGGMLTNFSMIKRSIDRMISLETEKETGLWQSLPKQEVSRLETELLRLHVQFDGVRSLTRVPDALFVVDVQNEQTALREAKSLNLPVVALVDTNADPTTIDYPIPANDDATKALELLIGLVAEAFESGRAKHTAQAEQASAAAAAAKNTPTVATQPSGNGKSGEAADAAKETA